MSHTSVASAQSIERSVARRESEHEGSSSLNLPILAYFLIKCAENRVLM